MCTVTYIPVGNSIFLTSNRDEQNRRLSALPPDIYTLSSGNLIFPKDADSGGTWIAFHENGNAIIFLNGAREGHKPEPPYRKSRGLILVDLIDHITPFNSFLAINLNRIEPFTAIILDTGYLFECSWDGRRKSHTEIDAAEPHIWSSSTLYDDEVIRKRAGWFSQWLDEKKERNQQEIMHFHQFTGDGNIQNDLLMNREGRVATVSITSMAIANGSLKTLYFDVKNNRHFFKDMVLEKSMAGR